MNKYSSLFFLTLLLIIGSCNNTENIKDSNSIKKIDDKEIKKENLPDVIKNYSIGIEVIHSPDTIYAELNGNGTSKYIWKHSTTVTAINNDLKIIEFGSYNFIDNKWVLGNYSKIPFNSEDFSKWYCRKKNGIITFDYCKDGKIKKKVEYVDPSNYSIRKDSLVNRNGLWYYIGIDSIGNKFVGYGRYVIVGKLKN